MTTVPKAEVFKRKPTYNDILSLITADADKVTLPERTSVEIWDSFAMGQYREMLQQTAAGDSRVAEHKQINGDRARRGVQGRAPASYAGPQCPEHKRSRHTRREPQRQR